MTTSPNGWTVLDKVDLATRAERNFSSCPRPFLRWAGSKRLLLRDLVPVLPDRFRGYREPFLGGGSLYFLLSPRVAVIGDQSAELIDTYQAVRDAPEEIIAGLAGMTPNRETYYRIRSENPPGEVEKAVRFIYLNKTAWNGLYRVNGSGRFNVPYGRPKSPGIADATNLRACSKLLSQAVELMPADFEQSVLDARQGDLVYLDPPYVTGHSNNGFIDYNERLFSWADQERLAKAAARAVRKGATVVVSNAFHQAVLDLYRGFHVIKVSRHSTLASNKAKRVLVDEALLVAGTET